MIENKQKIIVTLEIPAWVSLSWRVRLLQPVCVASQHKFECVRACLSREACSFGKGLMPPLPPLLQQRWNVALVCLIGVFSRWRGALFPSTEASPGCQSLGNVSEKLDTFRPQRHSWEPIDNKVIISVLALCCSPPWWVCTVTHCHFGDMCCQLWSVLMFSSTFHALWGWRVTCTYRRRLELMWSVCMLACVQHSRNGRDGGSCLPGNWRMKNMFIFEELIGCGGKHHLNTNKIWMSSVSSVRKVWRREAGCGLYGSETPHFHSFQVNWGCPTSNSSKGNCSKETDESKRNAEGNINQWNIWAQNRSSYI